MSEASSARSGGPAILARAALSGLLVLLAACGSSGTGSGASVGKLRCPDTFPAPNLDSYTQLRPGASTANPQDIAFGVKLTTAKSTCRTEASGVRVVTVLTFAVVRNDAEFRQGDFGYFVAVTDAQQNILAKQNFALRVDFAPRQKQMRVVDEITEHLPVKDVSTGGNYAIIVGLQLDRQQLELNRQRQ